MASPTSTQNSNELPQYTERHKIVIQEGEMVSMDGQLLKETKQMTTVTSDDPSAPEERIYKEVSHFYQHINIGLFSSKSYTILVPEIFNISIFYIFLAYENNWRTAVSG